MLLAGACFLVSCSATAASCNPFVQEKLRLRKIVVQANGLLNHFVIMVYWTRPGVGIKQISDGKQAPVTH